MEGPPRKRLETAVHDVIVGVLAEHLNVAGMRISVHRLYAPVGGALHSQGKSAHFSFNKRIPYCKHQACVDTQGSSWCIRQRRKPL